jgi:glycosyltransferase involved in cell wall biosynthesis
MKLYYIAYALMPTDKAHGIHIAKTCEAFIESGIEVTLLVPNRKGSTKALREFYGLRTEISVVRLPVLDLGNKGPIRYRISAFSFVFSYMWYLWRHAPSKDSAIYTVDIDHFSFFGIPLTRIPYFSEIHGGKKNTLLQRFFFRHISGVVATTVITKKELLTEFSLQDTSIIVEPNGVDIRDGEGYTTQEARKKLGIEESANLVLYVGRVLAWKGIDILPLVAEALPDVTIGFLGATKEEYEHVLGLSAGNVTFYGSVPHTEVDMWLQAADACLVLGTPRDEYSYRYTSPMKVFEYLASGRPVLASKTPAFTSVLTEDECYFFEPDSSTDLVRAIKEMYSSANLNTTMATLGKMRAGNHTWRARAQRIISFMKARRQS